MPYLYDYTEADGFQGTLIFESKYQASEWQEENPDGEILLNEEKTARYNCDLSTILNSREQRLLFRDQ
jgi:hypothetical protein